MKYFYKAIKFLLSVAKNSKLTSISPSKTVLLTSSEHREFSTDIYLPKISPRGAVILLHGMNKHGKNDPRMKTLGLTFSELGWIAVIPNFEPSMQHLVEASSIPAMQDLLCTLLQKTEISQFSKVGIFCASFTASLLLRSIYLPKFQNRISSVCIVGGTNDPKQTLETILSVEIKDRYAKLIVIKNMLKSAEAVNLEILQALDAAIDDEFEARDFTSLKDFLETSTLSEPEKAQVWDIVASTKISQNLFQNYQVGILRTRQAFDAFTNLAELRAEFVLVHSQEDAVIPPRETELLYRQLKAAGVFCIKEITPLLDHADYAFRLRYLPHAVRLVRAFARFLARVETALFD